MSYFPTTSLKARVSETRRKCNRHAKDLAALSDFRLANRLADFSKRAVQCLDMNQPQAFDLDLLLSDANMLRVIAAELEARAIAKLT